VTADQPLEDQKRSEAEALSLTGHDRDCALAMLSQARLHTSPLDEIQMIHLLSIGFRAGQRAGRDDVARDQTCDRRRIFPIDAKVDAVFADGSHRYWSTHCRHDRHDACSATTLTGPATTLRGVRNKRVRLDRPVEMERQPAQCKTCAAPCLCACHKDQRVGDGSGVPVPLGTPPSVADGDAGPVPDAFLAEPDPVLDAERLARARHRLAADSPFNPVPPWEHLTDHERELSILDATNYLKALDDAGYELLPATFRAGYAEAVARLRDDDRYRNWWTAHPEQQFGTAYWAPDGRQHLAAYLETVGPDGPDVTSAAREEG
jgi:hypothetical protein